MKQDLEKHAETEREREAKTSGWVFCFFDLRALFSCILTLDRAEALLTRRS